MCFGSIGVFHLLVSRERFWVRCLSDASYWLYLWYLPLIVAGQRILVEWPVSPHLKFAALCLLAPVIPPVVYRFGVRYTPVGNLLNGRRTRASLPQAA